MIIPSLPKKLVGVMEMSTMVAVVLWVYTYGQMYQIVHFRCVWFTESQLYTHKAKKKTLSLQHKAQLGHEI